MADYRTILARALADAGPLAPNERRRVYDQARELLDSRLSAAHPPPSPAEIRAQRAALAAAIEEVEREVAGPEDAPSTAGRRMVAMARWRTRAPWIASAVAAAAVVAVGFIYWTKDKAPQSAARQAASEDLAPGVDGGSTPPDLPFYLRRQLVYYRTTYPTGSIVAHKSQNYLYLVMPNATARRYSFGLGEPCMETNGSRRVTQKEEWPAWQPDKGVRLAGLTGPMPGGPGNPLGARALDLDDGSTRIHGTNAAKTIGSLLSRGCIRLMNDDVIDLYGRVALGTRVVITN